MRAPAAARRRLHLHPLHQHLLTSHLLCCAGNTSYTAQDKILQSMSKGNEVTVTNDGATILKSVYVDNPAAKVLVGELWATVAALLPCRA